MTSETNLALLSEYDFIVAIDASGSMGETDMRGGAQPLGLHAGNRYRFRS